MTDPAPHPVTTPPTPETDDAATEPETPPSAAAPTEADASGDLAEIDLDAVSTELDAVDAALARLADGTYWTDEVTGEPLPEELLTADPLARRVR